MKLKKGYMSLIAGISILFIFALGFILKSQVKSQIVARNVLSTSPSMQIKVGGASVHVTLAKTDQEITKGLGGTLHLDSDEGMLFVFVAKDQKRIFWMKDMIIPIDIIWIKDGKVVQIDKNIPAPASNTPDNQLKLYPSNQAIDYVLEVNAGFSDKNNIKIDTPVDLSGI